MGPMLELLLGVIGFMVILSGIVFLLFNWDKFLDFLNRINIFLSVEAKEKRLIRKIHILEAKNLFKLCDYKEGVNNSEYIFTMKDNPKVNFVFENSLGYSLIDEGRWRFADPVNNIQHILRGAELQTLENVLKKVKYDKEFVEEFRKLLLKEEHLRSMRRIKFYHNEKLKYLEKRLHDVKLSSIRIDKHDLSGTFRKVQDNLAIGKEIEELMKKIHKV